MLQSAFSSRDLVSPAEAAQDAEAETSLDLDRLFAAARRQYKLVILAMILALVLGLVYIFTAVPQYTAKTDVLIDQSNKTLVDQLSAVSGMMQDEPSVLSQVELLKSDKIALAVVDALDLTNNNSFMASTTSMLGSLIASAKSAVDVSIWFSEGESTTSDDPRRDALATLQGNVDVDRVGRTYVLSISYTSPDRALAAKIAQGFADAYLADQLSSKYDATKRASAWLEQRIADLRGQSLASDLAVQKFRAENGLIAANGQLVSEQQLSEVNTQLIAAQADSTNAEAKFHHIQALIDSGDVNAAVADSLASPVIGALRERYYDDARREADISKKLGSNHVQAINLRNEMQEYKRLIFEELGRIAQSYKNDFQVARTREQALRNSLSSSVSATAEANKVQVQLRELERESETYRSLYQTFLQRYQEAEQQQSFPITEARVISAADIPQAPSRPRKPLVLALCLVLGAAAGAGLGALREFRDRFFRVGEQVRDELGLEFLGLVPAVQNPGEPGDMTPVAGKMLKAKPVMSYVLGHPLSSFAETMRSAKIAAELSLHDERPKIIGIVSVLPGEGKSTVSANFAQLLAVQGAKTLLIDGDLRNPEMTRSMGRHAEAGLVEAVLEDRPIKDLLLTDPESNLAFLPAALKRPIPHTSELLTSPGMNSVLAQASGMFDYIVVDLPPLAPVVDARAFASRVDAFIFVVEWGRTARRAVRSTLASEPLVTQKCLGVILNKVDDERMKLYRAYGASEYYYSRYSSYYREKA